MIFEALAGAATLFMGASVCPAMPSPSTPAQIEAGLVVQSLVKGRQADRLGMRPGDIIYTWSSGAQKGIFESPFDPAYIAVERGSRSPVVVYGKRGRQRRSWRFDSDAWSFQTRPNFQGQLLSVYLETLRLALTGNTTEAVHRLTSCSLGNDGRPSWLVPWFYVQSARILMHAGKWEESNVQLKKAIELSAKMSPIVRLEILRLLGSSLEFRGDLPGALQQYSAIRQEAQLLDPDGMEVAMSLLMLASVEQQQDDLSEAATHLDEALNISRRLAPHSYETATIREHLGILDESRNDLENAQRNYAEALRIEEKYFPKSRQIASTLTNLGTLAHWRGDLERAETYHRKALLIAKAIEQNGPQIAEILNNLGDCLLEQGYPEKAELYQTRALRIQQSETPGTLVVALTLASLGEIERIRRDFPRAQDYYRRAISAAEQASTPEQEMIRFIAGQASVLRDQREYRAAEEFYRRALAIVVQSSPGSIDHAEILAELAGTLAHQGQWQDSAELYRESLKMIDDRTSHLGGLDDDRSRYRASNLRFFHAYSDVLLQQGRQAEALEVIEGTRARTLLEMLAQGHINTDKSADPALLRRLQVIQEQLQRKTESRIRLAASEHTPEQLTRIDSNIDGLSDQKDDIESQLRLSAPEYSALKRPQKLSLIDIQKLLDDETVLLEYSLGDERSHLWALTNQQLVVRDLLPKDQIESAARKFYRLCSSPPQSEAVSAKWSKDYESAAWRLMQMILKPVAAFLGGKRLVIVADGALQYVSFAALPDPGQPRGSMPLIAQHEVVNLASASLLAEIRRRRKAGATPNGTVAIMADPVFDSNDGRVAYGRTALPLRGSPVDRSGLTRSAADLGLKRNGRLYLSRLIYTRKEAEAVASAFPRKKVLEALDFEASRSTIISGALAKYQIVHFATHGLLNSRRPELSGLILSLVNASGKPQDGFLTLQDIYDLKLQADLVVLSGCETALGKQISGEGLVGLTRGFMYAGANRVIASLWSVSDSGTAELMALFYKQLQAGVHPAAALRAAQLDLWQHTQWRSPYYWAAFQLQGDWR